MSDAERLDVDEIALLGDVDDDFYGLWEVDWFFNGSQPDWSHDKRARLLSALVERGLVNVYFGELQTERPPLTTGNALRALGDPSNWLPLSDGQKTGYYVTASAAGIAARQP